MRKNKAKLCPKAPLLRGIASVTIITFAAFASPGRAQTAPVDDGDRLTEIVVTAQRRAENLQTVPIAVTAINGEALAKAGINATSQLNQVVPSVQITRSGPQTLFFVRGVGNISGAVGEEGANAVYVDGVYLGDMSSMNTEFNNVERIEVLKGPQGTLFGRNSSGGLIHIITREPGDTAAFEGSIGYGNYDTVQGQVYAATPLSKNLAIDLALTGRNQDAGWGRNLATGKDYMLGWSWGARSKLVWRPTPATKVVITGDVKKSSDSFTTGFPVFEGSVAPGGVTYAGDYNINSTTPGVAKIKAWGGSAMIEQDLDWATLTSLTAARYIRVNSGLDTDGTPAPLAYADLQSSNRTFQQEVRLASNGAEPLGWQFGLFYYHAGARLLGQTITGTAVGGIGRGFVITSAMKTNSYAAFGEATWAISDSTYLTGGLRYTHETRGYEGFQAPVNQPAGSPFIRAFTLPAGGGVLQDQAEFDKLTFRIALRQELGDDVNVYASYNRGFKAGLFVLNSPPGSNPPVKPQTIDAYEVGVKSQLFDDVLRLNLSAFHYDIADYQVRAANPAGGQTAQILNAAKVKVDGLEAEFEIAPTRGLRINGNAVYLDSRYADFPSYPYAVPAPSICVPGASPPATPTGPATGGNIQCFGPATGNRTALSPRFAFNVGANYTLDVGEDGQAIASLAYVWTGRTYFDTDNRLNQPHYGVLNATLEYKPSPRWGIEIWGRNLTDSQYYVMGQASTTFDSGQLGAPRTYGVDLQFEF
jgi:iron complex outermembrane receptor protein